MAILRTLLVFSAVALCWYFYHCIRLENECAMTYTYEITYMDPIPMKGKALEACQRYTLGVYRESEYHFFPVGSPGTVPVLFIAGSQGTAKQVRSLATVSFEISVIKSLNYSFEFFSLDFFEDPSALSAEIVEKQTDCVVNVIPFIRGLFNESPIPILLVGHSMGGVIAHYALSKKRFDASFVNSVITLASPLHSPVISLGQNLNSIYEKIHAFWQEIPLNKEYDHLTFASFTGGMADYLVWDGLGKVDMPSDRALHLTAPTINRVWVSTDHLCILWCNQMVLQMNLALFANMDEKKLAPLTSRKQRMHLLRSTFLSHTVPLDPPPQTGFFNRSEVSVEKRCVWVNRTDELSGVHVANKAWMGLSYRMEPHDHWEMALDQTLRFRSKVTFCNYLKIGPLSGKSGERVLLLDNNTDLRVVYLCHGEDSNSSSCSRLYQLPSEWVRSIAVPANESKTTRVRNVHVIGFHDDAMSPHKDLAGRYLVLKLVFRNEGTLLFDFIRDPSQRHLTWDTQVNRREFELPRAHNHSQRSAFYRIELPASSFLFGVLLPSPRFYFEPGHCDTTRYGAVGLISFSLPWDNQVYHHRFNPVEPAAFGLQTMSPPPAAYLERATSTPFMDIIIDPRCDSLHVRVSYSYVHWVYQVLRVYFFHCMSLVGGHILLSTFFLLSLLTLRLRHRQAPISGSSEKPYLDLISWRECLLGELKATRCLVREMSFSVLVAVILSLLHTLRLMVDPPASVWWSRLLPSTPWIDRERRGDLGDVVVRLSDSPLLSGAPFLLLNLIYAIVVPVVIHCLADCRSILSFILRTLNVLTMSSRPGMCGGARCGEESETPLSPALAVTCICLSFLLHDGFAFSVLALAVLLRVGFSAPHPSTATPAAVSVGASEEAAERGGEKRRLGLIGGSASSQHQCQQLLLAIQLRFMLLLAFCSFLCLEQWATLIFRIKVLLAGYGVDWFAVLRPSVFQGLLLVHLLLVPRVSSASAYSPSRWRQRDHLALLLAVFALFGCLVCLGGFLGAAGSLEGCLHVTMVTTLLLGLWASLVASTPSSSAS